MSREDQPGTGTIALGCMGAGTRCTVATVETPGDRIGAKYVAVRIAMYATAATPAAIPTNALIEAYDRCGAIIPTWATGPSSA